MCRTTDAETDGGLTLVELLATIALAAIVMTSGWAALRHFWLARSLDDAAVMTATQMRSLQQRTAAEPAAALFGGIFEVGSSSVTLVRYEPGTGSGASACTRIGILRLPSGVEVAEVAFGGVAAAASSCAGLGSTETNLALFYARGGSNGGRLTLVHPSLAGRSEAVTVAPLTGRVASP